MSDFNRVFINIYALLIISIFIHSNCYSQMFIELGSSPSLNFGFRTSHVSLLVGTSFYYNSSKHKTQQYYSNTFINPINGTTITQDTVFVTESDDKVLLLQPFLGLKYYFTDMKISEFVFFSIGKTFPIYVNSINPESEIMLKEQNKYFLYTLGLGADFCIKDNLKISGLIGCEFTDNKYKYKLTDSNSSYFNETLFNDEIKRLSIISKIFLCYYFKE